MDSGIEKLVARIDDEEGPYFTVGQVATMLGVSRDTIRRWAISLGIPNHSMKVGEHENAFVWLYTESDIAKLKKDH